MITHTDERPERFWERFYAERIARWSGEPNRSIVAEAAGLAPGTVLELGCGEGADAIWFARQGWTVTAVDISATALGAAAEAAARAGVADAIRFERRDLAAGLPAGSFDLVATAFLHSPAELPRAQVLRAAAAAVAVGGRLLIVGHAPSDAHPHADLPAPEQVLAELALPDEQWELHAAELREVVHAFAGEEPTARVDTVVHLRRLA